MDSPNPESASVAEEEVSRETTTIEDTTSTSTVPGANGGGGQTHARSTEDTKPSFRSSHVSRQTVADLETKASKRMDKSTSDLSRASSNSTATTETQPGAVAMYRSGSGGTSSGMDSSGDAEAEEGTSCRPAAAEADQVPMIHAQLAADNPAPLMIQAQLAEDPPEAVITIPQAQLVAPPQEAYHVQFDEEDPPPPGQAPPMPVCEDPVPPTKLKKLWTQHGRPCIRFSLLLLVVGLIAGLIIPRMQQQESRSEDLEDRLEWLEGFLGEDIQNALAAPTPAPSKQTVYNCYDSALKIALAQADNPSKTQFVICPNTLIPIGALNEDNEVEGGDYPLTALGDDVEIRCGLDGRRENHCILDGGFLQVILQPSLPDALAGETVNRTDNVIFRGITFTGELNASRANIGGVSVLANNPGQGIAFVDCAWQNLTAPRGLAQIGDRRDAMTFAPTTDVTFEDCTFSNIVYDGPMIGVYGQAVTLRRSLFEDLRLPPEIEPCPVEESIDWCQGLLYCFERSECELEDICVSGLEYAGPAAVATASSQTNLTVYGSKASFGLNLHPSVTSTSSNTSCSTGLAQFEDPQYQHPECLLETANWTRTDSCML